MSVSFQDPETDIMDPFLGPETDIMGERNFMSPAGAGNLGWAWQLSEMGVKLSKSDNLGRDQKLCQ